MAPASGTPGLARGISSVSDRAGSGDNQHARPATERILKCDLHIADDFDLTLDDTSNQALHSVCDLRSACAGNSRADPGNLTRRDLRLKASFMNSRRECIMRAGLSHALYLAAGGSATAKNARFVTHQAARLGSAAVDTEEIRHRGNSKWLSLKYYWQLVTKETSAGLNLLPRLYR